MTFDPCFENKDTRTSVNSEVEQHVHDCGSSRFLVSHKYSTKHIEGSCEQGSLWSACADAQADLRLPICTCYQKHFSAACFEFTLLTPTIVRRKSCSDRKWVLWEADMTGLMNNLFKSVQFNKHKSAWIDLFHMESHFRNNLNLWHSTNLRRNVMITDIKDYG